MSDWEKRLAVYLSDAYVDSATEEAWASVDAAGLLKRLRRNKVPLLAAHNLRPDAPVWGIAAFQDALAEERASLQRQRTEFAPVRHAFDAAGIPNVLIKSAGIAPSFPYRSDNMDVLVPMEAELEAAEILYGLGYVELRNVEEPRKFLFKRFAAGREVSAIHLHTQVGWGTGFLVDDWLWKRVQPSLDDPLVNILGPEDEALVTLAHAFYEDKEFKIWDLVKVRHCLTGKGEAFAQAAPATSEDCRANASPLRTTGFDWDYCARHAEERGWLHGLQEILRQTSRVEQKWFDAPCIPASVPYRAPVSIRWAARYEPRLAAAVDGLPSRVPFVYSKLHYFTKVARDRRLTRRQKWDDALRHALAGVRRNLGLFSQNPMLIALSGADGSGKTAHAEALKAALDRCDIRARIVWSRGASSPLTDALIRVGKRMMGSVQTLEVSKTSGVWTRRARMWRRPAVRRLWPWALALDLWRLYLARVAWPLLRGKVVIADRYVADAQVEVAAYLAEAGGGGVPFALRLLEWISPKPALRFLLDVPPEVAAQRKGGQESVEFLRTQIEQYRQIAGGSGWRVLDAARLQEELSSEIVRVSLLQYYRRYHTFINSLFLFNTRARRPFLRKE